MRKLNVFLFTTLNGYYEGEYPGDIRFHQQGGDQAKFSEDNLKQEHILLFGGTTFRQMASLQTPIGTTPAL